MDKDTRRQGRLNENVCASKANLDVYFKCKPLAEAARELKHGARRLVPQLCVRCPGRLKRMINVGIWTTCENNGSFC